MIFLDTDCVLIQQQLIGLSSSVPQCAWKVLGNKQCLLGSQRDFLILS